MTNTDPPEPMPTTTFGLIRHSRTQWNEEQRIQGHKNSPLTSTGQAMARRWGSQLNALPWDRLLISDLGRAQETTALINQQLHRPVHTEPLLREQDWGKWSGLTFPLLLSCYGEEFNKQDKAGWNFQPPEGETRRSVLQRGKQALEKAAHRWPGETLLVVCHDGIIKTLLHHLQSKDFRQGTSDKFPGYYLHLVQMTSKGLRLLSKKHLQLDDSPPSQSLATDYTDKSGN